MNYHRDVDHIEGDPDGRWLVLHRQSVRRQEPFAREPQIGVGHFVDPMWMELLLVLLSGTYSASPPPSAVALLVLDSTLEPR